MPLSRLIADLAAAFGLAPTQLTPAPLAFAGHGASANRRDPNFFGLWRNASQPGESLARETREEHFMNNARSTTMWRNADETRPPVHHSQRPSRHAGHRPRVTSGQRLAQALFDLAGPLARLVRHGETQWSSATFTGSRHTFVLRFQGAEAVDHAEALTLAISDDEVTVLGALIAEITVTRFSQTLLPEPEAEIEISALLLDQ
ncbi:hypothetical protein [Novosphingobium sp. Fuku2-ISO-50]|uniref:hypothetical protein n=1 Tax=Novosphingobium sp. Fuku2-ISO-50 TaxID=1739114 RepID=UPI00076CBAEC|nr:hypothetical protein [Novosphingobium sp. Fuku2-ISO-50]KUR76162.1 hypothetical protein AQZ50_13855 [Novosphingobium sp. Fuku2-ISO-50]